MQEHYTPKNKHLTLKERQLIEAWINEGKSNRCKSPVRVSNIFQARD